MMVMTLLIQHKRQSNVMIKSTDSGTKPAWAPGSAPSLPATGPWLAALQSSLFSEMGEQYISPHWLLLEDVNTHAHEHSCTHM